MIFVLWHAIHITPFYILIQELCTNNFGVHLVSCSRKNALIRRYLSILIDRK